jgi:dihydrofolate synthase/folylpolyglutamate synthase
LSIQRDTLGLEAIRELLRRLGDPHKRLPPVFHVAGTNGKGSTCAFLRAMLEAEGYRVHTTISPHLVRYNERFRVAGKLIEDDRLAKLLEEVFDAAEGLGCSFFEITIAAAFAEFARVPADACVVEVGLGGRLDATNVLEPDVLASCGIAALGIDHERFLLAPEEGVPTLRMARIAFEKAGIAKPGVPLVTLSDTYPPEAQAAIREVAAQTGAKLYERGDWWHCPPESGAPYYADRDDEIYLPQLSLPGDHQIMNVSLAIAMLRHQERVEVEIDSILRGAVEACWPARLQKMTDGPLTWLVQNHKVILDGGHNPNAGEAIHNHFPGRLHLVVGMLEAKDPSALTGPFGDRIETLTAVPVPGHDYHRASAFGPRARQAEDLWDAMRGIPDDGLPVLIAGSLYLAGEALRLNDEIPD